MQGKEITILYAIFIVGVVCWNYYQDYKLNQEPPKGYTEQIEQNILRNRRREDSLFIILVFAALLFLDSYFSS